ncbi:Daunorubicin/doxorubicin resistance ATP-binding protein DrrA [Paraconexibacter sp. AEG42_29]|uniref:Daunorubicin/doxorubicin resistance ATP-binding protein DrrA n=1 Tax=Paraconexibacter sp. AEG42_29 TaxID=2997339 RepID=A0AAU7B324_9ACTN
MTEPAIDVRDLHKRYDDLQAVAGVSFTVSPGEVFCLLGPNGAGKSTTTEILEGHRLADSGHVRVLGHDPAASERSLRERIGVVLQAGGIQEELTIAELVEMYGRWYERPRPVDELIDLVQLDARRDTRAGDLSGGQRRRLDLALGLVGDPDLLFLDEPTTGFDPHARRQAWSTIRALCGLGKTVFLTTHFMDEAQYLADRIAVMVGGRLVAEGSPESIGGRDALPTEIRFTLPAGAGLGGLPDLPGGSTTTVRDAGDGAVHVTTQAGLAVTHAITGWALDAGVAIGQLSVAQPTLEDVYLRLTEQPADTTQEVPS